MSHFTFLWSFGFSWAINLKSKSSIQNLADKNWDVWSLKCFHWRRPRSVAERRVSGGSESPEEIERVVCGADEQRGVAREPGAPGQAAHGAAHAAAPQLAQRAARTLHAVAHDHALPHDQHVNRPSPPLFRPWVP